MALEYTTTISEDLVTLKFTTMVDTENSRFITNTRDNSDVEILASNQSEFTVTFKAELDAEYKLTFKELGEDYLVSYLLISKDSIIAANLLNKNDVNKIIKQASIYNSSKSLDCLNRVATANHRVENYDRVNDILVLIEQVADNNCEEC